MSDTIAWCVLTGFRLTSVMVRLAFQCLESVCDFMISILNGYLSREVTAGSKPRGSHVLLLSSSRKGKVSRNIEENRTASNTGCNLTDNKTSPRNGKSATRNGRDDSSNGQQQGADYLPRKGISFNGSETFECNLRQAKKVTVVFEFQPVEDEVSNMQYVSSRTDRTDDSLSRKSTKSDVVPSENSTLQKETSEELPDDTEQRIECADTDSKRCANQEKVQSCKIHTLFKDAELGSEIPDSETKEAPELNSGNRNIDINQNDHSLNFLVQKRGFVSESNVFEKERSDLMKLNPTEDIQNKELQKKLIEKVENKLQSKNIDIAKDVTLQGSAMEDNKQLCMLRISEDTAEIRENADQKQGDILRPKLLQEKQHFKKSKTGRVFKTDKPRDNIKSTDSGEQDEPKHSKQSQVKEMHDIKKAQDLFVEGENMQKTSVHERRGTNDLLEIPLEKDERKQLQVVPDDHSAKEQLKISAKEILKPNTLVTETTEKLKDKKNVKPEISLEETKQLRICAKDVDETLQSQVRLEQETEILKPQILGAAEADQTKIIKKSKIVERKEENEGGQARVQLLEGSETVLPQIDHENNESENLPIWSQKQLEEIEKSATFLLKLITEEECGLVEPCTLPDRIQTFQTQNTKDESEVLEQQITEKEGEVVESKIISADDKAKYEVLAPESEIVQSVISFEQKYRSECLVISDENKEVKLPCDEDIFSTKERETLLAHQQQKIIQPVEESHTVKADIVETNTDKSKLDALYDTDDLTEDRSCDEQEEKQMKFASEISDGSVQKKTSLNFDDQELQKKKPIEVVEPTIEKDLSAKHETEEVFSSTPDLLHTNAPIFESTIERGSSALQNFEIDQSLLPKEFVTKENVSSKETFTSHGQKDDYRTAAAISSDKDETDLKDDSRCTQKVIRDNTSSDESDEETIYSNISEKGPSITLSADFLLDPHSSEGSLGEKAEHIEFDFSEENRTNTLNKIDIKLYNNFTGSEILANDLASSTVDWEGDKGEVANDYYPLTEVPKYWEKIRIINDKYLLERREVKCFIRNPDYLEAQIDENTKVGIVKDQTNIAVDSLTREMSHLTKNLKSRTNIDNDSIKQSMRPHLLKKTGHIPKNRMSDDMDTSVSEELEAIPQIHPDLSTDKAPANQSAKLKYGNTQKETGASSYEETDYVRKSHERIVDKDMDISASEELEAIPQIHPDLSTDKAPANQSAKLKCGNTQKETGTSSYEETDYVRKSHERIVDKDMDTSASEELEAIPQIHPDLSADKAPANQSAKLKCGNTQKETGTSSYEATDYVRKSHERIVGDILGPCSSFMPITPDFLVNPFHDPSRRYDIKLETHKLEFEEEYSVDKWNKSDRIFYYNVMGCDVPEGASSIPCSKECIGEIENFYDPATQMPRMCNGMSVINNDYFLGKREIRAYDKDTATYGEKELMERKLSDDNRKTSRSKLKIVKVPAHSPPKRTRPTVIRDTCPIIEHECDSDQKAKDSDEESKQESRESPKVSSSKLDWYELTVAAEKELKEMSRALESADGLDSPPD